MKILIKGKALFALILLALLKPAYTSAQPTTVYEVSVWQPQALHAAIAEASKYTSGNAAVAKIIIKGTGALRTQGIPLLAGLEIECEGGTGFWKPQIALVANATEGLFVYPGNLKGGGGGANVVYPHHTVIRGCTISGNRRNQREDFREPLVPIYNGGFQNRIENSHLKDSKGPCVFVERTALNTYIHNTDFSGCEGGAVYADLELFSGVLGLQNAQVDNSGGEDVAAITVIQRRRSAWQGAPGIVSIRDYQFEFQEALPKAIVEVSVRDETGLGMIYDGLSIGIAHNPNKWKDNEVEAIILDSSTGTGVAHHDIRSVRSAGVITHGFAKGNKRLYPRQGNNIIIGSEYVQ